MLRRSGIVHSTYETACVGRPVEGMEDVTAGHEVDEVLAFTCIGYCGKFRCTAVVADVVVEDAHCGD